MELVQEWSKQINRSVEQKEKSREGPKIVKNVWQDKKKAF